MLRSAIAQLSPEHREIIQLRYFGDCSYQEIATALGVPVGTVMSRLHAARRALVAISEREPR
jgi:RNA polymerase sigma-70 factor (ECF subfamily)